MNKENILNFLKDQEHHYDRIKKDFKTSYFLRMVSLQKKKFFGAKTVHAYFLEYVLLQENINICVVDVVGIVGDVGVVGVVGWCCICCWCCWCC